MTGRDLIIYILEHNLEDKPVVGKNGIIGSFLLTVDQAAMRLNVGNSTIRTLCGLGKLKSIVSGSALYIFEDSVIEYMKSNGGANA